MEDVTNLVARQYEAYSYPPPTNDLSEHVARGDHHRGDPSIYGPLLWPEGRSCSGLRILIAGCGTMQAAWYAYTNPTCEIVGIDISEASLAHQKYLQARHGLKNLRLFKGDLREVGELGESFDLVVSTGVLHHMADPDEGLRALVPVIAPGGVFAGMVYGSIIRSGVYMLQDAFRRLGVEQNAEGVAFVRHTLQQTPPWHFVKLYESTAPELSHDAALVDTFLHPQDRAYAVAELLQFVEGAGLHLHGWFDNAYYFPDASFAPDTALYQRIAALPDRDQWIVTEQIAPRTGMHSFVARRERWQPRKPFGDWRPHRAVDLQKIGIGQYRRGRAEFSFPPQESALLDGIDGERTVAEIAALARVDGASAEAFFKRAWKQGHLLLSEAPRSAY
jgi:SAM-dependent methyltransferase